MREKITVSIDTDLLTLLDKRVKRIKKTRSKYLRGLIVRDILASNDEELKTEIMRLIADI